jgi:hypothetical protein
VGAFSSAVPNIAFYQSLACALSSATVIVLSTMPQMQQLALVMLQTWGLMNLKAFEVLLLHGLGGPDVLAYLLLHT